MFDILYLAVERDKPLEIKMIGTLQMASLVWVRRKTNMCEVCGRVMEIGETYKGHCQNCGNDFCSNCHKEGVCKACAGSSLFRAGPSFA